MPTYGLDNGTTYPTTWQGTNTSREEKNPQLMAKPSSGPIQSPGNNLVNQGYTEQAFELNQNRLMEDPFSAAQQQGVQQAGQRGQGAQYMEENQGSLDGPGRGQQYWNQQSGQFMSPFAGEQFGREQAQNMSASGPAGAFYNQAMGQYGDFTGYSGPQNTQGQYGASQQQLGNGTQGQQNMSDIAGQYGSIGQYGDPNLAAGQYAQTQQAFGDMPIANFDPFYDRARQLGVQSYNQGAAGRGVYGSSEALSGVGNVITDIEAQRANRSFDAEMQRTQEQRMRQQLLGEQARAGDLSSLSAFGANLAGVETFGNLNNQMGQLQNDSNRILGDMANNADSQALGAQNANISGLNAFGNLSNNADAREIDRFDSRTNAMEDADRAQLDRLKTGANIANDVDANARADYDSSMNAASNSERNRTDRLRARSEIANTGSDNDLARLDSTMGAADMAENDRQDRQNSRLNNVTSMSKDVQSAVSTGLNAFFQGDQAAWEDSFNASIAPYLQEQGYSQQQIDAMRQDASLVLQAIPMLGGGGGGSAPRQLDTNNPYG